MWYGKTQDRLEEWRLFRLELNQLPFEEALKKVSHLWSYAPFVRHHLAPEDGQNWPNPWTLLHENCYCDVAKALGMLYTIYLTNHRSNITEIEICLCKDEKEEYALVNVNNGQYILNYVFDEVVNKEQLKELESLYIYTAEDLNLAQY